MSLNCELGTKELSTVESLQYDFDKIRVATNDFADANKLGEGGFGAVYHVRIEQYLVYKGEKKKDAKLFIINIEKFGYLCLYLK